MSRKRYLRVKDFDTLQHYKNRSPVWIKLYSSHLDDYDFLQMKDATKYHIFGLMLLASRMNNCLPDDAEWLAQKIGATEKIDVELLINYKILEVIKAEKNTTIARKSKKIKSNLASTEKKKEEYTGTHTQNRSDCASKPSENSVCDFDKNLKTGLSKFSLEECLRYTNKQIEEGVKVSNPHGFALNLYKTGDADDFIKSLLDMEKEKFERRMKIDACNLCDKQGRLFTQNGMMICSHTSDGKPISAENHTNGKQSVCPKCGSEKLPDETPNGTKFCPVCLQYY